MDSCFLIEMKFISKLFKKFRRGNESQEIPRLRLFIFSWKIHRIWSKIIKHNSKNENSRLLIMYSNPWGSEFGTWHLSLTKCQIIILFSSFEFKNRSHGGKSIFHVDKWGVMRFSHRKVTFVFVGKSWNLRNEGFVWWNRHLMVPKLSRKNK